MTARANRGRQAGLFMAALFVPLLLVGGTARVMALTDTASRAKSHLVLAKDAFSGQTDDQAAMTGELSLACDQAAQADTALQDVNGQVGALMPLLGAVEALPGVGNRARSQAATLDVGTQLAAAGVSLCQGLSPLSGVLSGAGGDQSQGPSSDTLRSLVQARPRLLDAADRLDRVQKSLEAIRPSDLDADSRASLEALQTRLPALSRTLRDSASLLTLLGADSTKRFLVVSQNPDELRPTGGYIGSAGVMEATAGQVKIVEYGSSRNYDTPSDERALPPDPASRYLGPYWHLAGANWSPSFPGVAHQLEYFYGLSHPEQRLDGVVAMDQYTMQDLLQVLGPVNVPDYNETVSADTVQNTIDKYVHNYDQSEQGRKQFTAALSAAVMQKVLTAPRATLPDVIKVVRNSLDAQHLLIWTNDSQAETLLASKRWDGNFLHADNDYLMLVDTEVTTSKQSQEVSRKASYNVDLSGSDGPRAQLHVTYQNNSSPEQRPFVPFSADYRTYLRAYGPANATLVASQGFNGSVSTTQECGRTVFGGEVSVPAGTTARVELDYRLPGSVAPNGLYDLVLQQQPGVPSGNVAVQVKTQAGTSPAVTTQNQGGNHAHLRLGTDGGTALAPADLPTEDSSCNPPVIQAQPIAQPVWIQAPSIKLDAPIVEIGVSADGQMDAPPTPDVVGWYRMSARAGEPGNEVMGGHVDWGQNTAVFWGLRDLKEGDPIIVRGADGLEHRYAVEWNKSYGSGDAPVASIIGGSNDTLLTLITCDGVFDKTTRDYLNRRVVRAKLVS